MARLDIPQDPDIDWRSADNRRITPVAAVVHKTIGVYSGPDSGDSEYIEQHELAHIVIGETEGEWEQVLDTEAFAAHCNGANYKAVGVEFSDLDPTGLLNDWQCRAWAHVINELERLHGIPKIYLDPNSVASASVWVNGGGFEGWLSHDSVRTDDGSTQHYDRVPVESWDQAINGGTVPKEEEEVGNMYITRQLAPQVGIWSTDGIWRHWVTPDEWNLILFLSGLGGKPAPAVIPLSDQAWNSYAVPNDVHPDIDEAAIAREVAKLLPAGGGGSTDQQIAKAVDQAMRNIFADAATP